MKNFSVNHSCADSALKCVDCSTTVCPKCMVQCAVGNRCKKCADRFTSHVLKVSPAILIRTALAMGALGIAYGYIAPFLTYAPFGIYGYVVKFLAFFAVGKVMHRFASYKLGGKLVAVAAVAFLTGLAIGPFRELFLSALNSSNGESGEENVETAKSMVNYYLIDLAIMTVGLFSPFVRK